MLHTGAQTARTGCTHLSLIEKGVPKLVANHCHSVGQAKEAHSPPVGEARDVHVAQQLWFLPMLLL